ncbi:MAG: hypothetical protein JW878_07660 [Methanomicrobia archaeon]|nr:hypothetical protein [Methanomicrobia archaeon]
MVLIVGIIGVRQLHGLSTGKAALAVILAILIPAVIVVILFAALGPTMPGPSYPGPVGPGFGGF